MDYHKIFGDLPGVLFNEPMSRHTTFRIGGRADVFATPSTEAELEALLQKAKLHNISVTVIGNASNILVRDGGIRGLVIATTNLKKIEIQGTTVLAGAGNSLYQVALAAAEAGLGGLEFAAGIPGSIGGAAFMNAGAYDGSMEQVVKAVRLRQEDGKYISLVGDQLGFCYRKSALQNSGIITAVLLQLQAATKEAVMVKIQELAQKRSTSQPLNMPSAGSVFKHLGDIYPAKVIDELGLKGLAVGGAQVSEKHAGFIVNKGNAKASDVLELVEIIKTKVKEERNLELKMEIVVLGEDNKEAK